MEQEQKLERDWELSEEFLVQVAVHRGSMVLPLLFAMLEDVILENAREGLKIKIFYADDLVLMSESIGNLKEKFLKCKEASKWVEGEPPKAMVSDLKGEVLISKVDQRAKCSQKMMANLVMGTKCGKWVHGRCAKMKRVT